MSSPEKRKKKTKKPVLRAKTQTTIPNPSLPDDLLLSCFARISRLHYLTLSLVSKSFRSLLASPELYKARSILGRKESCLYVCLLDPNPRWFTLYRKPHQTLTNQKEKSSGYVLAPVPIPHSTQANLKGVVAVGSSIYVIGGHNNDSPSSSVSILDCQSHTWSKAPSMRVKRNYPAASVFDGKIYVAGGCKDFNSSNWMEVFDPKTQTWEPVLNPFAKSCSSRVYKSLVIGGKVYMFGKEISVAYKPKEDIWADIREHYLDLGCVWSSYCAIDNVIYCCTYLHGIKWYNSKIRDWINLKGLEGLSKFNAYGFVKLADYGGKMAVFWSNMSSTSGYENKVIWCAVITLEKRNNSHEIWGKLEWCEEVLTVPNSYGFMCAVAATV